jgi:hypothetical protein
MKISTIAILLLILKRPSWEGFMAVRDGELKMIYIAYYGTLVRHDDATMTEMACHHAHCLMITKMYGMSKVDKN